MQISPQILQKLSTLMSANPNEAKAIVRLLGVEVLGTKANGEYLLEANGAKFSANSQAKLGIGERYWVSAATPKEGLAELTNPIKMPKLLANLHVKFGKEEFMRLFMEPKPAETLKEKLLDAFTHAATKEEAATLSPLLLSLQSGVISLPLFWYNRYAILQFKKRYNTKTKKSAIDFYAAFLGLGPMSGVLELDETKMRVNLHVAFESTRLFLQNEAKEAPFLLSIALAEIPEPLFDLEEKSSLLDTHI